MTEKEERFCLEWIKDPNATKAYMTAYPHIKNERSARTLGARLLAKVDIQEYIKKKLEQMHSEKTADAKEVIEYLTSVMRGEHTEQTLRLVGEGVQTIADISVSAKDRLKAAELLGKRYGLFRDKLEVESSVPIVISGGEQLED